MIPDAIQALRTRFPDVFAGKSDAYIEAWSLIQCELGAKPADAQPPARWLVDADGNVGLLEHAPVRSAWRTGAALASSRMPQWRGVA